MKFSCGVIDERIHGAKFFFGGGYGYFYCGVIADVGLSVCAHAISRANFLCDNAQRLFSASDEKKFRAEARHAQSHGASQAGAATGEENCASCEKVFFKHGNYFAKRFTNS